MTDNDSTAKGRADAHFKGLKADKTTNESKRLDEARVKADADKTARLKAARLERDEAEPDQPPKSGRKKAR